MKKYFIILSLLSGFAQAESAIFSAQLPDLQNKMQSFAQWKGKPAIINFWATWCSPCREEIPEFIALQKQYAGKVRFIGVAIDEQKDVAAFAKQYGINYPVLFGEANAMELMRKEGNQLGGLPFTAIYNAKGERIAIELGRLKKEKLENYLKELTR
ncbi:TlpA family protein disulfide reductase [Iodobacter fluviatilis]|uniref:Thiol-disulfide isomerase/thioredoxin n=1 Tax=Iodobacter fluviatilis TaxID=537 RepID=A0A377Q1P9_9NEIS|nr:TlpA disulfide reductase family protein [Iodobacter fluviatilis]TCU90087.1 thiol-disulfide isomerase/thioredoxin [Iodobacter fluviatilis]STQ89114.1 Thiol-disulfide oxidoreductase resA [Iodobacter fluviatilis]